MVVTGSEDYIEPATAAWQQDFTRMCTRDKVYLNVVNGTHMFNRSPLAGHPEGAWIAQFLRSFVLGDTHSKELIFGNSSESLVNSVGLWDKSQGDRNNGDGVVGFLACRANAAAMPPQLQPFCSCQY